MTNSKGKLLQLQHFSVNDGEGIRTIVFFAGCSLRCKWCANPEGYTMQNKIMYIPTLCTSCGSCTEACPQHLGFDLNDPDVRSQCNGCGLCVPACLDKARKNAVSEWTVDKVVKELESQMMYFQESGGGVTYSGGECTNQPQFLADLVAASYDLGLNQAMETSGTFDFDQLKPVLDDIDLLFMDIKHMDPQKHQFFTGMDNSHILNNVAALGRVRGNMIIRIPVIMGVNGDDANIMATAAFVKENLKEPKMELLPYHVYGVDKYAQLGMDYPKEMFRTPTDEEYKHQCSLIEKAGVELVSFK